MSYYSPNSSWSSSNYKYESFQSKMEEKSKIISYQKDALNSSYEAAMKKFQSPKSEKKKKVYPYYANRYVLPPMPNLPYIPFDKNLSPAQRFDRRWQFRIGKLSADDIPPFKYEKIDFDISSDHSDNQNNDDDNNEEKNQKNDNMEIKIKDDNDFDGHNVKNLNNNDIKNKIMNNEQNNDGDLNNSDNMDDKNDDNFNKDSDNTDDNKNVDDKNNNDDFKNADNLNKSNNSEDLKIEDLDGSDNNLIQEEEENENESSNSFKDSKVNTETIFNDTDQINLSFSDKEEEEIANDEAFNHLDNKTNLIGTQIEEEEEEEVIQNHVINQKLESSKMKMSIDPNDILNYSSEYSQISDE